MERRDFMIKSGTVITAAALLGIFGNPQRLLAQPDAARGKKRPDPDDYSQPILKAIAMGINAPSPHNTQSWKFKVTDDMSMLLYVNENILLPETDPPGRQIHIGAGCFIETLVIGATALGYSSVVTYFPEGYDAASDAGKKPVAKIALYQSATEKDPLADYIGTRHTNRQAYKGALITDNEFAVLTAISTQKHTKPVLINKGLEPYIDIFKKAFDIETRTFRTNEETRHLFRFSAAERAEKGDGLSIPQMGFSGIKAYFAERSLKNGDKDTWHSKKTTQQSLHHLFKGIDSAKGFVFWTTDTNTVSDWVKTGRDFARFCLALTKQGLYAHPYTQATQEYAEMNDTRNALNEMMHVTGTQKIQMIVRIGRSTPGYVSYRRKLESGLIK